MPLLFDIGIGAILITFGLKKDIVVQDMGVDFLKLSKKLHLIKDVG